VTESSCLFCRIVSGEAASTVLHRDDAVIAFRDIAPRAPTHILLVPCRHVSSVLELGDDDGPLLARIFSVAADLARSEGIAENGFRIVANTGPWSGQSVAHLHFHLLGGRSFGWPPG